MFEMDASLHDSGFWFSTHFMAEEDKLKPVDCDADLFFPNEFPYDVDSPVSSTQTDCSDDGDFLSGVTRRFAETSVHDFQRLAGRFSVSEKQEKQWVSGGSPQSTLSGVGCWSGDSAVSSNGSPNGASRVSSPPATPFGFSKDSLEVIYAAAGEVARLKMKYEAAERSTQQGPPRSSPNWSFYSHQPLTRNLPNANQFHQLVKHEQALNQSHADWGRQHRCGQSLGLPLCSWPQVHGQRQQPQSQRKGSLTRTGFPGGTVAKRESAGTGVFLPRRYTNPPEYRKKTGCSPVLVPAKVVHALNLNFNHLNGYGHSHVGGTVSSDLEALLARRNALLMEQRRSMRASPEVHDVRLPVDWTY